MLRPRLDTSARSGDIPTPSETANGQVSVPVPTVVAAKLALYSAMRAQRITKVDVTAGLMDGRFVMITRSSKCAIWSWSR